VTIHAKHFSPNLTSNRAAAFWFPYHVRNDKRGIGWALKSYAFFKSTISDAASGISMCRLIKAAKANADDDDTWTAFMPEGSFRKLNETELPNGYAKAYEAFVPLIETQLFLPWLQTKLLSNNVQLKEADVTNLHALAKDYDIVVNCSGLAARQLCNDNEIFAVRGQVNLLEPGFPDHIFLDNQTPAYLVPRKDATIVGGTYEENEYDAVTVPNDLEEILQKAYAIFPELKNRKVIGNWAGLRPFRPTVRLEKEGNIIHNYGHGGSGYTLSFGCAEEVAGLVAGYHSEL
jgi:D-amino-acid oxidase